MPFKQLIVNADDFGLSPGVNRGIIAAHRRGIVTSTTLMVNRPAAAAALEMAGETPDLGVGLHLNLTTGRPLSDPAGIPSLVDGNGNFTRHRDGDADHWRSADIHAELGAQVARFLALTGGRGPTHLDSHHHTHRDPKVLAVVLELAAALRVPVRPLDPERLTRAGIRHADFFVGHTYFPDGGLDRLLTDLRGLGPGTTEIMSHPGYADDDLRRFSRWVEVRERELAVLTAPQVVAAVGELGITLVNYRTVR